MFSVEVAIQQSLERVSFKIYNPKKKQFSYFKRMLNQGYEYKNRFFLFKTHLVASLIQKSDEYETNLRLYKDTNANFSVSSGYSDSHNKEIFVGDILKYTRNKNYSNFEYLRRLFATLLGFKQSAFYGMQKLEYNYKEVLFYEGQVRLKNLKNYDSIRLILARYIQIFKNANENGKVEVIGNIYQNPALWQSLKKNA